MSFYLKNSPDDSFSIDVYWEEEFLHTVDRKLFFKELTALPPVLTRQEFSQVFFLLEVKLAKRLVVRLLARKGYLSRELEKKLSSKGFSIAAIEQAITFGQKGGYIDDEQELQRLIRSEMRKGSGPQAIVMKLKHKRVSEEQLKSIKEELRHRELTSLQEWLAKKRIEVDIGDFKQRQKLYAQLMRRGFSAEAISSVLKNDWN